MCINFVSKIVRLPSVHFTDFVYSSRQNLQEIHVACLFIKNFVYIVFNLLSIYTYLNVQSNTNLLLIFIHVQLIYFFFTTKKHVSDFSLIIFLTSTLIFILYIPGLLYAK